MRLDRENGQLDPYDPVMEAQLQALLAEGALGKAAKHLTSEGVHDASAPDIRSALESLHPQPEALPTIPPIPNWGDCLTEDQGERKGLLRDAIKAFPPGSSAGPSGLRPRHVQDILQGDQEGISALLHGLSVLSEACQSGALPVPAASWLCSATLIP